MKHAFVATLGVVFISGFVSAAAPEAGASLRRDKITTADNKKNQVYVRDGLVIGGDRAIDSVTIRDIRRAPNAGFERLVIDLEGTRGGEPAAIPRPPYYQIAVSPEEKRMVVTIWGKPHLAFDPKKVIAAFKKSNAVASVDLFPRLDDDSWTFALGLKDNRPVEVFELTNPVRIIVDIRSDKRGK